VLGGLSLTTGVGELVAGGDLLAEGTLGAISSVSGAGATARDGDACIKGNHLACVGGLTGLLGFGGGIAARFGVLSSEAQNAATAIGLTIGTTGYLGDAAGSLAATGSGSEAGSSFASLCDL
jgi:hypothetical protein